MAAQGIAHPDLASALAARMARLDEAIDDGDREQIRQAAGGTELHALTAGLFDSVDPDANDRRARERFELGGYQEPTDAQIDRVEREAVAAALKPFHNPALRETILRVHSITEQVIDEVTQDTLLAAGYDIAARQKARDLLASFRRFCDEHKDEIEALQILYSRPYRAGLRYNQVKELARKLGAAPFHVRAENPDTLDPLWRASELDENEDRGAKGKASSPIGNRQSTIGNRERRALVDLVALVRHAIDPRQPLVPVGQTVEERYGEWLAECARKGLDFTAEQHQWIEAIKDHIAQSLHIAPEDFDYAPFSQMGGMGKAWQVFGERLNGLLEELNERLAA